MTKICLVNDDGPSITGFVKLAEALSEEYELSIVVPAGQRSASSKSLTFNAPLRIEKRHSTDFTEFYTHSGTPADSVLIANSLIKDIDLFVSGINPGANLGYQSIMTSGTVGAAIEAAFLGYPSIAVSQVVESQEWFSSNQNNRNFDDICEHVLQIVKRIVRNGMPRGIDVLNMNFPRVLKNDSKIVVTRPTMMRMRNDLEERIDPNESQYYWIRGHENEPDENSDAFEVLTNGNISLSPIIISSIRNGDLDSMSQFMTD